MVETRRSWWRRRSLPLRVGIIFGSSGAILAVVGIVRGNVPLNPISILLALLISAGGWGVVSWAIATAVVDVESDLAADEPAGNAPAAGAEDPGAAAASQPGPTAQG